MCKCSSKHKSQKGYPRILKDPCRRKQKCHLCVSVTFQYDCYKLTDHNKIIHSSIESILSFSTYPLSWFAWNFFGGNGQLGQCEFHHWTNKVLVFHATHYRASSMHLLRWSAAWRSWRCWEWTSSCRAWSCLWIDKWWGYHNCQTCQGEYISFHAYRPPSLIRHLFQQPFSAG